MIAQLVHKAKNVFDIRSLTLGGAPSRWPQPEHGRADVEACRIGETLGRKVLNLPSIARFLRVAAYGAAGGALLGLWKFFRLPAADRADTIAAALGWILGTAAGGALLAVIAVAVLAFYKK